MNHKDRTAIFILIICNMLIFFNCIYEVANMRTVKLSIEAAQVEAQEATESLHKEIGALRQEINTLTDTVRALSTDVENLTYRLDYVFDIPMSSHEKIGED